MYMDEADSGEKLKEPMTFILVFAVLVALIIGLGIFPGMGISFSQSAVPPLKLP